MDPWVCIHGFSFQGLDLRVWTPGFGFIGLKSFIPIDEFEFLGLDSQVWIQGFGLLGFQNASRENPKRVYHSKVDERQIVYFALWDLLGLD